MCSKQISLPVIVVTQSLQRSFEVSLRQAASGMRRRISSWNQAEWSWGVFVVSTLAIKSSVGTKCHSFPCFICDRNACEQPASFSLLIIKTNTRILFVALAFALIQCGSIHLVMLPGAAATTELVPKCHVIRFQTHPMSLSPAFGLSSNLIFRSVANAEIVRCCREGVVLSFTVLGCDVL